MQRSSSRESYPLDKFVPRKTVEEFSTPGTRRVIKRMHYKKQRQWDSRICRHAEKNA